MNVTIKIIRSDNKEFVINGEDWKIPSDGLENWGKVENQITTTNNAIGDGGYIVSSRVGIVDRTITAISQNYNLNEIMRRIANSFFNPKYTYKIYLTYMNRTLWSECALYKFNCDTKNIHKKTMITATFLFPNPFLKSVDDFGKDIASVRGVAGFPYQCEIGKTTATGIYNFAQEVNLENDGDNETFCETVFRAKGNVINPKITVNGQYVRIIDSMVADDVIIVDFEANPPTVKKNGVNIIGKTDRTSSFDNMQLSVGQNTIQYDADSGSNVLEVSIYYNKLYSSI